MPKNYGASKTAPLICLRARQKRRLQTRTLFRCAHLHTVCYALSSALMIFFLFSLPLHVATARLRHSAKRHFPDTPYNTPPPPIPPPNARPLSCPSPPRSLLFGLSSHCCLQLKMSCRHLAPKGGGSEDEGAGGLLHPPKTRAQTSTRAHTFRMWASAFERRECRRVPEPSRSRTPVYV